MAEVVLDGREIAVIDEVHDRFAQALELPEHYGRNLDALFDCLTELREDLTVRLLRREDLERRLGRRGRALAVLLHRAAEENPHVTVFEDAVEN